MRVEGERGVRRTSGPRANNWMGRARRRVSVRLHPGRPSSLGACCAAGVLGLGSRTSWSDDCPAALPIPRSEIRGPGRRICRCGRTSSGWSRSSLRLGASGALVWKHFSGKSLPGAAPARRRARPRLEKAQSACAQLEAHPMGSLGGMWTWYQARAKGGNSEKVTPQQAVWPVSFLGAAYFAATLAAWVVIGVEAPARGCGHSMGAHWAG